MHGCMYNFIPAQVGMHVRWTIRHTFSYLCTSGYARKVDNSTYVFLSFRQPQGRKSRLLITPLTARWCSACDGLAPSSINLLAKPLTAHWRSPTTGWRRLPRIPVDENPGRCLSLNLSYQLSSSFSKTALRAKAWDETRHRSRACNLIM